MKPLELLSLIMVHHRNFSLTGTDTLADFLEMKCMHFVHIERSINQAYPSSFSEYWHGKRTRLVSRYDSHLPTPLLYLLNAVKTIVYLMNQRPRFDIYIAGDQLNALIGLVFRRLGLVKKVVFYSIDYFPCFFKNCLLNHSFHLIDRMVVSKSDHVWNSSEKIREVRTRQGARRSILVPGLGFEINSSELARSLSSRRKNQIVYLGELSREKGLQLVVKAMPLLLEKCRDLSLVIIGDGQYKDDLRKMVTHLHLEPHVRFTGFLPTREAMKELQMSKIGLATYLPPDKMTYTYYAFPGKVVQYMSCGLPVVMTRLPVLSEQIEHERAGMVVEYCNSELVAAILKLLTSGRLLQEYRRNAIRVARQYRCKDIFSKAFRDVLED